MDQKKTQPSGSRRSGPRSRKASLNCRERHTRCDEGKPVCAKCAKARLKCRQPDFLTSKWSLPKASGSVDAGSGDILALNRSYDHSTSYEPNVHFPKANIGSAVGAHHEPEIFEIMHPSWNYTNFSSTAGADSKSDEDLPTPQPIVSIDAESAHLLRVYERGIGTWMDVFDMDLTFQRDLLNLVHSSALLLNAVCALAARQMSITTSTLVWKPIAERYYGRSVHLLACLLNGHKKLMELAIVSTMLLSSYELLAFPGPDYHRHFRGATTIVDALHIYKTPNRLARASFWIYARHEVGEALNINSPTRHNPKLWPRLDPSETEPREDWYCNDILRICAEVLCFVFSEHKARQRKRRAKEHIALQEELDGWLRNCPYHWLGVKYVDNGKNRYWFPRPNFAAALLFYHVSKLLLCLEEKHSFGELDTTDFKGRVEQHSAEIIRSCLSDLTDAALVVAVHPLCHAAKHVNNSALRDDAVALLEDIQKRTGFHTRSRIERQLSGLYNPGTCP